MKPRRELRNFFQKQEWYELVMSEFCLLRPFPVLLEGFFHFFSFFSFFLVFLAF